MEEYISSLITYTAQKKGDPNASISAIPFNKLPNKDWQAREMAIDAADATTVSTSELFEEEEIVTAKKALYQRYEEKVHRNRGQGDGADD